MSPYIPKLIMLSNSKKRVWGKHVKNIINGKLLIIKYKHIVEIWKNRRIIVLILKHDCLSEKEQILDEL